MSWTLMPPGAAIVNASTAAENTSPKNARSQSCSAVNASSSVAVIRRTAPKGAKVAIRLAAPKEKKVQPPGMRIKAPKRKKKTRQGLRLVQVHSRMSLDEARAWFKDYENLAAKSGKA